MVSTRASSRADSLGPDSSPPTPSRTTKRKTITSAPRAAHRSSKPSAFQHAPSSIVLAWFAVSLPLVIWDTCYVLGRPHTMEGGFAHWPFWTPYKLYGEVDYVYGWKAVHEKNGFTAAQGFLNVVETVMYLAYLWLWYSRSEVSANGNKVLAGRVGAWALMIAFSAAVMTLSKTVLYWMNEYFSGFGNIGHNDLISLIFLWIIPNGLWLIGPTYMIWTMGAEILDGLEDATHVKVE
ncbi:hypothetical protein QQS21_005784 [Conoideocrella luteorostrata]|uniref:C6 transcription factor n=1 Tax=Conoideocrella luteorostrata TaxID=1105319 RepID=A0AAJ0FYN0_9HYPO|nr:hypothetical protein QQS21_005784 [Conoideocrella luteorostrata]